MTRVMIYLVSAPLYGFKIRFKYASSAPYSSKNLMIECIFKDLLLVQLPNMDLACDLEMSVA